MLEGCFTVHHDRAARDVAETLEVAAQHHGEQAEAVQEREEVHGAQEVPRQ